jgi:hypothetical protein
MIQMKSDEIWLFQNFRIIYEFDEYSHIYSTYSLFPGLIILKLLYILLKDGSIYTNTVRLFKF